MWRRRTKAIPRHIAHKSQGRHSSITFIDDVRRARGRARVKRRTARLTFLCGSQCPTAKKSLNTKGGSIMRYPCRAASGKCDVKSPKKRSYVEEAIFASGLCITWSSHFLIWIPTFSSFHLSGMDSRGFLVEQDMCSMMLGRGISAPSSLVERNCSRSEERRTQDVTAKVTANMYNSEGHDGAELINCISFTQH